MWPLTLVRALPAWVMWAALAALTAAAYVAGWQTRGWREDAARLDAERQAHETYIATVRGWQAAAQEITRHREEDRRHAQADRRTWQQQLAAARTAGDRPGPGLGPGDADLRGPGHHGRDCRDRPAVPRRLWDDALAIGLPDALRPRPPAGPGAAADPAAESDVPIDTALENLADNGQACNDLRSLLLDWQAWAKGIGAAP